MSHGALGAYEFRAAGGSWVSRSGGTPRVPHQFRSYVKVATTAKVGTTGQEQQRQVWFSDHLLLGMLWAF